MYHLNTFIIAALALILLLIAVELGHRFGARRAATISSVLRDHINSVSGSLLGILALLLGFTFSLSLQRFDSRSDAVVYEANCIGTAYLRIDLLDAEYRAEARRLFAEYVQVRIADGSVSLVDLEERRRNASRTFELQKSMWHIVADAAHTKPESPKLGLFIQSLNEVFDSLDAREAALHRHVPGLVLTLLLITVILAGAVLGYAAGASGHRPSLIVHVMNVLIIIIVFIIFDLDRPRRGLIQVDQSPMTNLSSLIHVETVTVAPK